MALRFFMASSIHQPRTLTPTLEKTGTLISDLGPNPKYLEKPDPRKKRTPDMKPLKNPDPKYQTIVKQKTEPIFCILAFHNKRIAADQNCISASEISLRQIANELCTLMDCNSLRKVFSYSFFAVIFFLSDLPPNLCRIYECFRT